MSNIINVKFYIDGNVYQSKEYDKQTVITLLNNNDINNDRILLGWSTTNNTVDDETIIYNGIYIPDINETEDLNFYPVWEDENDASTKSINIKFNDTKETSITTIPYENLSDEEKKLALTNNTSTVSFCYRLNYIEDNESKVFTQKFNVEYDGTDWTLNEIKTEDEYTNAIASLESKITDILIEILGEDKVEIGNNNIKDYYQIVWYRKSNLINDWSKVQNGDTLIGNVMLLEDKSLFVLPIIKADGEYIRQSYLSNNTNYDVHLKEMLHTSNGHVKDNEVTINNTARQYGVIDVLDFDNNVIFTSQKNEYESTAITVKSGNKYTLIAYPLHQGSRFAGWFRREEFRNDEKKTITIDYYQVSGPDETKYEIVVEDKDVYNQYGALFIGNPIDDDISNYNEYKFSTDNVGNTLKYYTFLTIETEPLLNDIKQLTPQYSDNNIIIQTNEGCNYIHIFTSKKDITFKINKEQSKCDNISDIKIDGGDWLTIEDYLNQYDYNSDIINELNANLGDEIHVYVIPCGNKIYGTICINVLDK
jgi:hypothetical protein